jgi:outer membrane usher protein
LDGDRYGDPAFLGFHRYGLTNNLTVGLRGEAVSDLYNFGPAVTYGTNLGVFDLALAGSRGRKEKSGFAGSTNYSFQAKGFNLRLGATTYSQDYSNISLAGLSNPVLLIKPKLELGGGISIGTKSFGTLALNYSKSTKYDHEEKEIWGLMYSKSMGQKLSLALSLNQTNENGPACNKSDLEFYISFTYYPWKETIMTNTGVSSDGFQGNFQIQKNAPLGEGYGYRASIDMREERNGLVTNFSPYFQYNGKYGIYASEFSTPIQGAGNNQFYRLNASGAIVYVGKTFGFSRPVDDSFAVIQVGQVPGVRIYHNNQEIGKTGPSGLVVLPNFYSYDINQIRIDDKDIPLDYALTGVSRLVSPSLRSGSLIQFEAKKVQAFTGLLKILKDGKKFPVEYHLITMMVNGQSITFQTGRDGEFFIEDAVPGTYKATFKLNGKWHTFDVNIPKSDEIIIDAGEIHVQVQP